MRNPNNRRVCVRAKHTWAAEEYVPGEKEGLGLGELRESSGPFAKEPDGDTASDNRALSLFSIAQLVTGIAPKAIAVVALATVLYLGTGASPAAAARRPTGVNKPELLPPAFTRVIDVAGFLSDGQEARLSRDLERLEKDTGYKVRLLAQNYPDTPGLAVKDFWGVDDATVVFVADPSLSGNILNFNVGSSVDLQVPRSFWSRLAGKYGNQFYWKENGEDVAIENAVLAIDACLREPPGPLACSNIK